MVKSNESLLKEYLHINEAYEPAIIPNQKSITFLTKKSGLPQMWKWDGNTDTISQCTHLPDRVLSVYHSHSGKKTIIGMDKDGNEKQQFYLLNDRNEVEELIVSEEHFHRFGGWSPDDKKICFTSNRRHPGYFDVYTYDFSTQEEKVVMQFNSPCTPVCWTKDGEHVVINVPDTNIDQSFYILHTHTEKLTKIGAQDTLARYASLELTNDGKEGFILSDIDKNTLGVHQFSLQNPGRLNDVFSEERWDIEEIKLSPKENMLVYTVNEGGTSSLGIYHLIDHSKYFIEGLPRGVYHNVQWLNDRELVVGVKSAIIPGDIWKVNVTTNQAQRLTWLSDDKKISHLWMTPELCHFHSFDGLEVPYYLYGKRNGEQPAVVYVHGGPEHQIREEFNPVIQFLAHIGYAVIAPNVRGSMGYGRQYVKMDDVRKRMDAVADLKWLVKDLGKQHKVDLNRVGIMGRSYGGFMVLAALTHYPDIWAAGVDIVGISHFKSFLENTGPWRRKLREFEYGSLKEDVAFFEDIAPLNHTDKITAPLLVFHGRNDTRVPVNEAEQLTKDLKDQNKQVELHVFEDEGHQTEKLENHIFMNSKIVSFMETYLKET